MQNALKMQGRRKYKEIQENDIQNSPAYLQMQEKGQLELTWRPDHQMGGHEMRGMNGPISENYSSTTTPELDQFQMLEMQSKEWVQKPGIACFQTGVWDTPCHF